MKQIPYFSIAIPTYNRSKKLEVAINKILSQDMEDFEIVIFDNCSTDKTQETVKKFHDYRIRYFKNGKNVGVLKNIQLAIDASKGKYIFLHSDDDYLCDSRTLSIVKKIIQKERVGYVRLNYLSVSPNGKHIFDFNVSKGFNSTKKLKAYAKPLRIIDFLLNSDCSFITGSIFINIKNKKIRVLDSHLYPWFPYIYFSTQKFGAYYLHDVKVLAYWSEWLFKTNGFNPLYSIVNGRLTSESYLEFVKDKVSKHEYKHFLHNQLFKIYVRSFPLIKLYTGNRNMLELASRLIILDPEFKTNIYFMLKLFVSFLLPRKFLLYLKNCMIYYYMIKNKVNIL